MHAFISNKYFAWYNSIIEFRKINPVTGYSEKHHIIPKSLGGSNEQSNLVRLTAREHFICHRLLVKITKSNEQVKMKRALNAFSINSKKNPRNLTSKQYAIARESAVPRRGFVHTDATKDKISKSLTGKTQTAESNKKRSETLKGRTFTEEHLAKISSSLKGRVSPTKGMTFGYKAQPTVECPHCARIVSKHNLAKHIRAAHP